MPSTYSPSLRIELIGDGEQDGIWGQTSNNNLGELIEQAIAGITTVDVTAGNLTLTSYNGVVDEARSAVLVVNGSNAVTRVITIPNESKTYIVTNNTSQTAQIKTPGGTAFNCPTGTQTMLYCDGADGVFGASILLTSPIYSTLVNPLIVGIREAATVSATAATGTIQFDTLTQAVLYYTTNASANWTVNFRGNSGTTLNSIMAVGQSFSTTFMVTQGAVPYINTAVTVDGASVTPKWQGGTAPAVGNANSVDIYSYVIIKTASAVFSVFASTARFA